jgi:hypothetical protein
VLPFITSRWSDLVLLTFRAPRDLLTTYLPPGCELDQWEGEHHVSVVALRMSRIRLFGLVPIGPGHAQINLRTYIRWMGIPAVTFVRQIVPSALRAAVARRVYGEPFVRAPVYCERVNWMDGESLSNDPLAYRFGAPNRQSWISLDTDRQTQLPVPGSLSHHLLHRTHGCRADSHGRLNVFGVAHPQWAMRPIVELMYEIDFGQAFGQQWEFLNRASRVSEIYAEGSDVSVSLPRLVTR